MRLRGPALVAAALLAVSTASPCRASSVQPGDAGFSELAANAPLAVRFRADDHGALRALRTVYAAQKRRLWMTDGQPARDAMGLLRALRQADTYGLEPQDYRLARLLGLAPTATRETTTLANRG